MIVNGFGGNGGNGYSNSYAWKPITTWTLTNKKMSEIGTELTVLVNNTTAISLWDLEVLNASLAVKVVCNSWSWGGSHTASSSNEVTLIFSVCNGTSSSYSANRSWWSRYYKGYLSTTTTSIESIRGMYSSPNHIIRPLLGSHYQSDTKYFSFSSHTSTESTYVNSISYKVDVEGNPTATTLYGGPSLYGQVVSAGAAIVANTTLTCSISLMGYIG